MTVGPDVPDYSRPSVDVERRADAEWEWGVTHTVRPEKLAPMLPDVEYSITVKVQRRVTELDRDPTFAGLYARALTIAGARCHDFAREDDGRASVGHVPHLAHRAGRKQRICASLWS